MVNKELNSTITPEFIATKLSKDKDLISLCSKYYNESITNTRMNSLLKMASTPLLENDIIFIRENKRRTDRIAGITDKIESITKPLNQALKALSILDNTTKSQLEEIYGFSLFNPSNVTPDGDLNNLIDACEKVLNNNTSKTHYFIPVKNVFIEFSLTKFKGYYASIGNPYPLPKEAWIKKRDWDFFKELISIICFTIFDQLKNPPERLQDTKNGLKATFKQVKELSTKYFYTDFLK